MLDRLSGCDPIGMVDRQHAGQEIKHHILSLTFLEQMRVQIVHEFLPGFLLEIYEVFFYFWVEFEIKPVYVFLDISSSQHFCDFNQLVEIIISFEKWFSLEDHTSKHASCAPNIKLIIIMSHSNQEFRAFEESRSHPTIELFTWCVIIGKAPISNP